MIRIVTDAQLKQFNRETNKRIVRKQEEVEYCAETIEERLAARRQIALELAKEVSN